MVFQSADPISCMHTAGQSIRHVGGTTGWHNNSSCATSTRLPCIRICAAICTALCALRSGYWCLPTHRSCVPASPADTTRGAMHASTLQQALHAAVRASGNALHQNAYPQHVRLPSISPAAPVLSPAAICVRWTCLQN